MKENDLLIANRSGCYTVTVSGRANFEYAVPLRDLARSTAEFSGFRFDMKNCTAMDSTFMGVLTMLALKAKKSGIVIDIANASVSVQKLLRDLGVAKLFTFSESESNEQGAAVQSGCDKLTTAETVEEAHRTLADVSPEHAEKFKDVIEFTHQDVERLKNENK